MREAYHTSESSFNRQPSQIQFVEFGEIGPELTRKQRILRAEPWQYAGDHDGRKWRVRRLLMKELADCLAGFDRSGGCENIWASVNTIAKRLGWSRRKLFRTWTWLLNTGVGQARGFTPSESPTRFRALRPARLRKLPFPVQARKRRRNRLNRPESGTPGARECGTHAPANVAHNKVFKKNHCACPGVERQGQGFTALSAHGFNHHQQQPNDDFLHRSNSKTKQETIEQRNRRLAEDALRQAAADPGITQRFSDEEELRQAVAEILERVVECGIFVGSPNYFLTSLQAPLPHDDGDGDSVLAEQALSWSWSGEEFTSTDVRMIYDLLCKQKAFRDTATVFTAEQIYSALTPSDRQTPQGRKKHQAMLGLMEYERLVASVRTRDGRRFYFLDQKPPRCLSEHLRGVRQ